MTAYHWKLRSRLALLSVSGALIAGACDANAGTGRNSSAYQDDTFERVSGVRVLAIRGNLGLKPYALPAAERVGPLILDLRSARFSLRNSRNDNPTPAHRCDKGNLPINNNPVSIRSTPRVTIRGGLIDGAVPQDADWRSTYCNSAAVQFRDSPGGVVDGIRISRAWDGVRVGRASGGFVIKNSWLTEIRDDAIENDYLHAMRVEDTLIDGALQGLSVRPNAKRKIDLSKDSVEISGLLIRLKEHQSEKGRWSMGSLVKNDPRGPRITLRNSVIALDAENTQHWSGSWPLTWMKLSNASNNLVLWLSDRPMPEGWEMPAQGFRLLTGTRARAAWAGAKDNWINCHPAVPRLARDPRSDFAKCRAGIWGGYSR